MYSKYHFSWDDIPDWFTYLKAPLALTALGLNLIKIPAGKGYTFMHRHEHQEEVYIILRGRGIIHIEGNDISLVEGDIVRVSPKALRAVKAEDQESIILLCAGAVESNLALDPNSKYLYSDGRPDWENLPPWYKGNKKIKELNKQIRASREKNIKKLI
ncbi:MAG: cupin domain-containing protein [Fidelibacterota bacterium]